MNWILNTIGCYHMYIIIHAFIVTGSYGSTTVSPNAKYNITHKISFEIEQQGKKLGEIIFGLYGDVVPKTVSNFRQLALMSKMIDESLTYVGSRFYKIVPGVKIEGGDIIHNNGTGQTSIWKQLFEDENFLIKHSEPGIVSMVNNGPNTNGCQFFITLDACPSYDGIHVAFGKIVSGMDVVHQIAKLETNNQGEPRSPVVVSKTGKVPVITIDTPLYNDW